MRIARVVSGGQTGVDRAALDAAIALGVAHGGWVPRGRLAEDGPLDSRYEMRETPESDVAARTEANVRDSDATLIVSRGPLAGGSALTWRLAETYGRPRLHVDLAAVTVERAARIVRDWLATAPGETLNVAGPRASEDAAIYELARDLLTRVLGAEDAPGAPATDGAR